MTSARPLLLGEGQRDVGRFNPGAARRPPCDFEGDLPRLVRRLSEHAGGPTRFGYDAELYFVTGAGGPSFTSLYSYLLVSFRPQPTRGAGPFFTSPYS